MSNTFLGGLLGRLVDLVSPLKEIAGDPDKFGSLLREMGWNVTSVPQYNTIVTSIDTLRGLYDTLQQSGASEETALQVLFAFKEVYDAVSSLSTPPGGVDGAAFLSEFPLQLFDYLIIHYLNKQFPRIYAVCQALGIITFEYHAAITGRLAYTRSKINYDKIGGLINDPLGQLKSAVGWDSSAFLFHYLIKLLFNLFAAIRKPASFHELSGDEEVMFLAAFSQINRLGLSVDMNLATVPLPLADEYVNLGVRVTHASGATLNDSGIILSLAVPDNISVSTELSDSVKLTLEASTLIGEAFAFLITPGGITFNNPFNSGAGLGAGLGITLSYNPEEPTLLIGKPEGTRLEVRHSAVGLDAIMNDGVEIILEADLSGIALIIDPGQSDSFISKVLGDQPREISFPITIRWSGKHGISFKGSGSFEFNVNLHFKLGPIEFNDIKVALRAPQGQDKVKVEIGTNIKGDLGPILFNVDNLGLGLTLGLHEGNAGPFDIKLGFKPPTGVGLSINAGPVKGGGFLNYDESTWTYTGGLELNFSKISFSAIGIVSTKLPGGEKGYSLLIIITAEFGPIPLGMGFTLNGLGGILGLHRTMNPDVLRTGIRDNTLDHILFPKDIVKNANTIISNINQAFPIKKDQFLVGPMAKIGWGTPTLLTIELGIIIELPEPVRLAILGVVKALLPSKENPIVRIQINFLGIIDFTNKYLSFDASLYDSQILTFGLFGDMALRLYWGDKPAFLLSVGGFHPKFTPPPLNLPELRRLTLVLANQDNLKISVETYFAVTSNSVQFGAKVSAMAKAWKIQAIGALWFDILFQFKPFYFIADMGVMFAIKMGSKTILSLFVQLTLEGPNPWRAQGKGSFKVLFVKVSVSFDKTFGQARVDAIEAVDVNPKLIAALTSDDNWEALLPERSHQMVAFREETTTTLSVDPGGSLRISQRLLPLQTELQKFGSSAIRDSKRFDIAGVTANGSPMAYQKVQDYFARNEFYYMKDEEKLSRPSYELFDSGVIAGSDSIASAYAVHKVCDFEEITIDLGYRRPEPRFKLATHMFGLQRFGNYVSRSPLSDFDGITTSKGPDRVRVSLDDDQFVLADRNNLSMVAGLSFSNSADAERYLAENMASAPAIAGEWIVANRFELATW